MRSSYLSNRDNLHPALREVRPPRGSLTRRWFAHQKVRPQEDRSPGSLLATRLAPQEVRSPKRGLLTQEIRLPGMFAPQEVPLPKRFAREALSTGISLGNDQSLGGSLSRKFGSQEDRSPRGSLSTRIALYEHRPPHRPLRGPSTLCTRCALCRSDLHNLVSATSDLHSSTAPQISTAPELSTAIAHSRAPCGVCFPSVRDVQVPEPCSLRADWSPTGP